jgi:hypothetical protein
MLVIRLGSLLAGLLLLQTVILPHFAFWGVIPDVILVAVIIFAVLDDKGRSPLFAAGAALGQDFLARGGYWQVLVCVLVSALISVFRDRFLGEDQPLAVWLVAMISPLYALVEAAVIILLLGGAIAPGYFILKITAGTIYNLLFVPLLFSPLKRMTDAG